MLCISSTRTQIEANVMNPDSVKNRDLTERGEMYTFDPQINHNLTQSSDITELHH